MRWFLGFDTTTPSKPPSSNDTQIYKWEDPTLQSLDDNGLVYVLSNSSFITRLPQTINGWQFPGFGQDYEVANQRQDTAVRGNKVNFPYVEFRRNDSIPFDPRDPLVPYNSTIWYNKTELPLEAPFLEFSKDCHWSATALGECICYNGIPIVEDFRIESRRLCMSGESYYWGFSSSITSLGLILECVWCFAVVYLLVSSTRGSNLIKLGRSATGPLRGILDLAEVINGELGGNTCLYRDDELGRELSRSHPVGYDITEREDGAKHLGLVSVPEGRLARRTVRVNTEEYYG